VACPPLLSLSIFPVLLLQSTPLDTTDVVIDNQFLPLLKEVLGQVPEVMARSAGDLDAADAHSANQPQQQQQQPSAAAGVGNAGFGGASAGRSGVAAFSRAVAVAASSSSSSSSGGPPPPLKLDDATLATVSRAIMGRLDVVDLVGKNTALDVADRVSGGSPGRV
jgi:cell division protease FtsH